MQTKLHDVHKCQYGWNCCAIAFSSVNRYRILHLKQMLLLSILKLYTF